MTIDNAAKVYLDDMNTPRAWYNIVADLPTLRTCTPEHASRWWQKT